MRSLVIQRNGKVRTSSKAITNLFQLRSTHPPGIRNRKSTNRNAEGNGIHDDHPQQSLRTHRRHATRQASSRHRRRQGDHRRQSVILQSRRIFQGPHRGAHHRRRGALRTTKARRCDSRTDLRQHRRRARARRTAARLPYDLHAARQSLRIQACRAARIRRRSRRHPHR